GHSGQEEKIKYIVADGFEPASEIRLQQFQTSNFPITSIQDARKQAEECTEQGVPVSAQSEEYGGTKANSECEDAHHVCSDWKLDELSTNRNGNAPIQLRVHAIRSFDQPMVQLFFCHPAVLL